MTELHIVLFEPEIPPNTGNIIRLCANTGASLHLIQPFAFELDDKRLRRAGLDYKEWANMKIYDSYEHFIKEHVHRRLFACSTKGKSIYAKATYQADDMFLFGPETRGLPMEILNTFPEENIIHIPMQNHSRSLNLSNAAAVILYEAWRQLDFV